MTTHETGFNYYDDQPGYFYSDERKWINKIKRLAQQYPNDVHIIAMPENNDGNIYVKLPRNWFQIRPQIKHELTIEQRTERAERLKKYNNLSRNRSNGDDNDETCG